MNKPSYETFRGNFPNTVTTGGMGGYISDACEALWREEFNPETDLLISVSLGKNTRKATSTTPYVRAALESFASNKI